MGQDSYGTRRIPSHCRLVSDIFCRKYGYGIWYGVGRNDRETVSHHISYSGKCFTAPLTMVFAGAVGNIIDSLFYGLIFNTPVGEVATIFPDGGGYGAFMCGKVVDMFYFPLWSGILPEWLPIWGGQYFTFFPAVFNIADAAVSVGIILLLLFQKKAFDENAGYGKSDRYIKGY